MTPRETEHLTEAAILLISGRTDQAREKLFALLREAGVAAPVVVATLREARSAR
jgi:hypothetical protein